MGSLTVKLPKKIAAALIAWPEVYASPKSKSLYNIPVELVYSAGAMRISDHWNTRGGSSFKTNIPVRNGYWTAAIYTGAVWKVLVSCPPRSMIVATHDNLIGKSQRMV